MPSFTPTQSRILRVLSDGRRHSRKEIHGCLVDELGELSNIQAHLSNIRKKLRPIGEDIICEFYQRTIYYRHVRLLASSNDG